MKLPRDLSGEQLVKHLVKEWQYARVHQVGSHIILETKTPGHHRIAIPAHSPLRLGTLNAILSSIANAKQSTKEDILRGL